MSNSSSSSGLSHGAIAGIVIGSVVGALLIIGLLLLFMGCCRGRGKGDKLDERQHDGAGEHDSATTADVEMSQVAGVDDEHAV